MNFKACDIFSYQDKKENKIYVLLSFFFLQKKTKINRSLNQLSKKIFIFNKDEYKLIPETINSYFKSLNTKFILYSKCNSISERIAKKISYRIAEQKLSKDIDNIGVYALLNKLNHPDKNKITHKKDLYITCNAIKINNKEFILYFNCNDILKNYQSNKLHIQEETLFSLLNLNEFNQFVAEKIANIPEINTYRKIILNFVNKKNPIFDQLKNFLSKKIKTNIDICNKKIKAYIISNETKNEIINNIDNQKSIFANENTNHVLYTDGSVVCIGNNKYVSGAYVLHTEEGYKYGSEVLSFDKKSSINSKESEFLAFYLGLNEIIKLNLTNKPLTFIIDSDDLFCFLNQCKNKKNKSSIFDNLVLYKIKKLLKQIDFKFNALSIKSHSTNSIKKIEIHNQSADNLAYNSIIEHLNKNNIKNNMKIRVKKA